jgi:hypothetical protein
VDINAGNMIISAQQANGASGKIYFYSILD